MRLWFISLVFIQAHASTVLLLTSFGCRQGEVIINLSPQNQHSAHNPYWEERNLLYPDWTPKASLDPSKSHWAPHHNFLLIFLSATIFSLHLSAMKQGKFNMFLQLEQQNTILSTVQTIPIILWMWFSVLSGKELMASSSILLFLTLHQNALIWHYVQLCC